MNSHMDNEAMVNYLTLHGYLKSPEIIEAFLKIDRKDFVPEDYKEEAYEDSPIPLKHGQTTSAPCVIAVTLEMLKPMEGEKILEVGTGSGYLTALLSYLVGKNGKVYTIEYFKNLSDFAKRNLKKYNINNVVFLVGDAKNISLPEKVDKIVSGACVKSILDIPSSWMSVLKDNGIIVTPCGMDDGNQYLIKIKKEKDGKLKIIDIWGPVRYVSLL